MCVNLWSVNKWQPTYLSAHCLLGTIFHDVPYAGRRAHGHGVKLEVQSVNLPTGFQINLHIEMCLRVLDPRSDQAN